MEIERKWLMEGFPDGKLEQLSAATLYQGYLCTKPVVRIRASEKPDGTVYILCFKGKGTLAREEIELSIDAQTYARLSALLPMPAVRKEFRTYRLPGGETLECSLVDPDADTAFYYAEVEFETVEAAHAFVPPVGILGEEKTEEGDFSMGHYWERKLAKRKKSE